MVSIYSRQTKKIIYILWHHRLLPLHHWTTTQLVYFMGKTIHRYHGYRHQYYQYTRKSLLFHKNCTWSKRNTNSTFDITIRSFDSAEICKLVNLFILNSLEERFGKNVGLYCNDGLAVVDTCSGRLCDKERKELISTFNDFRLKITIRTNQQCSDFLDLTFDLINGTYIPYRKPNDKPIYINCSSNHPLYGNFLTLSTDELKCYLATKKHLTKQHKRTMPWSIATSTLNQITNVT